MRIIPTLSTLSKALFAIECFKSSIKHMEHPDKLSLSGYGLVNENLEDLSQDIQSLDSLKHLDLSNNRLTQVPEWMGELANLESLNLENNELEGFLKETEGLISLEELRIGRNALVEFPKSIGNLRQLRVLEADRNRFRKIPQEIEGLKSLERLVLWGNHIRKISNGIGEMRELETLIIPYNQLRKLPKEIGQLQKLVELRAERNLLREIPDCLGDLTSLELLNLWGNLIKTVSPELKRLKRLKELTLDSNRIAELPEWLSRMDNLKIEVGENPLKTSTEKSSDKERIASERAIKSKEKESLFASDTPYSKVLNQAKYKLKDKIGEISSSSTELTSPLFDLETQLLRLARELNIISKYQDESNEVYQYKLKRHAALFIKKWENKVDLFLKEDSQKNQMEVLADLSKPRNIDKSTRRESNMKRKRKKEVNGKPLRTLN